MVVAGRAFDRLSDCLRVAIGGQPGHDADPDDVAPAERSASGNHVILAVITQHRIEYE